MYLPVDDPPLVLVAPRLDLHLNLAIRGILGDLERLRLCNGRDVEHAILYEVTHVPKVVQVL